MMSLDKGIREQDKAVMLQYKSMRRDPGYDPLVRLLSQLSCA